MERTVRVVGAAPPAQVWERYAVPARWSEWAPHIRGVDLDPGPGPSPDPGPDPGPADRRIAPGTTGRVRGPLGAAVTFLVTAVDEHARTWAWDVRLGPVRMHLRHGVEPDPAGTATWLTLRGPAPAVLAYLPLAHLALTGLVRP